MVDPSTDPAEVPATPAPEAPLIAEEEAIEQRIVPFLGDDLVAALTAPGDVYISLSGICAALGLHPQGQLQRIQRTDELAKGLRRIPLQTRGGRQSMNCLRLDKIGLWLGGVETARVKGEFRAKLVAYHEELAPVALRVFLRLAGVPTTQMVPATDPRLQALAEQYDDLMAVATFLREHLEATLATTDHLAGLTTRLDQAVGLLETLVGQQQALLGRQEVTETLVARIDTRTTRLTPAHQRQVQAMVDRMVRATKDRPVPLTHRLIYGGLKNRFLVGSYSEVPDEKFDQLMEYLMAELRKATGGEILEQGRLL